MNNQTPIVGSFAKGLKVLGCFNAENRKLSISEVAQKTAMDRATCRRLLLTLHHEGYADYDGKYFSLSAKWLRLGMNAITSLQLPNIVQPWLDQLSEKISQTCSVCVLDNTEIVYVARAAHKRIMSVGLMHGSRLPAYCTSMGRILLSGLPNSQIRPILLASDLSPKTRFSLTDPEKIIAEIERARKKGYAINDQEIEIGLTSIAIPVYNQSGKIVAALNVGIPATKDRIKLLKSYLPELYAVQEGVKRALTR